MDQVINEIIRGLGLSGALLIALASYLIKKEITFQKERNAFNAMLEKRHSEFVDIIKTTAQNLAEFQHDLEELKTLIQKLKQ